ASIPALAYLLWRYLVQRRFDVARDGAFLAVMTIVALPGLFAFLNSAANLTAQIDSGIIAAIGSTGLGMIGGYGLGLTHSVIAIPFILLLLVAVAAALLALRRPARSDPLVVSLLISLFCLVL